MPARKLLVLLLRLTPVPASASAGRRTIQLCNNGAPEADAAVGAVLRLPTVLRFCRRTAAACAGADALVASYARQSKQQALPHQSLAIVHSEKPRVGAGFAHVLQEQAQALLLGMTLGRPVSMVGSRGTFNPAGLHLAPPHGLAGLLYARHPGHAHKRLCEAVLGAGSTRFLPVAHRYGTRFPYRCGPVHATNLWLPVRHWSSRPGPEHHHASDAHSVARAGCAPRSRARCPLMAGA